MCYNNTIRPETREAPNLMSTREQGRDLKHGTMRRPRDKSTSTRSTGTASRLKRRYTGFPQFLEVSLLHKLISPLPCSLMQNSR